MNGERFVRPDVQEYLLQAMQTRVESARVDLGLANLDVQLVVDRCEMALEDTIRYVATVVAPGNRLEDVTFRAPKNSWHHFLRDLSSLPGFRWLAGKVRYQEEIISCTDIWPQMKLPERHGPCVRTVCCPQWAGRAEETPPGIRFVRSPKKGTIEL